VYREHEFMMKLENFTVDHSKWNELYVQCGKIKIPLLFFLFSFIIVLVLSIFQLLSEFDFQELKKFLNMITESKVIGFLHLIPIIPCFFYQTLQFLT
jgi:hypothetical protein